MPSRRKVNPGDVIGRLTIQEDAPPSIHDDPTSPKYRRVWALCVCGERVIVRVRDLRSGGTKSCGCLRKDNARRLLITHQIRPRERDEQGRFAR